MPTPVDVDNNNSIKSNSFVDSGKGPRAFLQRKDVTLSASGAFLTISHSKPFNIKNRNRLSQCPILLAPISVPATALLLVHRLVPGPSHFPLLCYPLVLDLITFRARSFCPTLNLYFRVLGLTLFNILGSFRRVGAKPGPSHALTSRPN